MSRFRFLALALACLAALSVSANADPFTYRAVVSKFGILGRHGGGVVSSQMVDTGHYLVDFASDVSACAIVATVSRATRAGGSAEKPGYISAGAAGEGSSSVSVSIFGMRGRPRDYAFHVLVACP